MATTSPDNLRTPDPGDPYNLVPDLQTLAQDVQDALTRRANVFNGTSSQRTAFTSTATNGMLWQDTNGIKMIWRKDGSAWVPAVWRWAGTTAQMNGFTQAPDGFEWYNTTDNSDYVRLGGAWVARKTPWVVVPLRSGISPSAPGEELRTRVINGVRYFRGGVSNTNIPTGASTIIADLTPEQAPVINSIFRAGTSIGNASSTIFVSAPARTIQLRTSSTSSSYYNLTSVSYPVD